MQLLKRGGCQQPNTQYTIQAWSVSSEALRSGYNIKLYVQCWTGDGDLYKANQIDSN